MTFAQYIVQTRVTDSARGRLIADLKANGCASVNCWADLFRLARPNDMMIAREVWWGYRKAVTVSARARLRETRRLTEARGRIAIAAWKARRRLASGSQRGAAIP